MYRVWILPLVIALAAGSAAASDDAHKSDHKAHAPATYQAAVHDADGKHVHRTFDMSKPADKQALAEMVVDGHVQELTNTTAPELSKIFSLKSELAIWTLIIFGLLFFTLSKVAWPKMIAGMQKREDNIRGALAEAEKAKLEAAAMRADLQKQLNEAHNQVKAIIDEAKRDAEVAAKAIHDQSTAEIAVERERLVREIQVATDQALSSLWARAADLATQVSAKVIRKQLDGEGHRRLIEEAVSELKTASANGHA